MGLCPWSSPCLCRPQATYVLLALAWVFVPIYISSEVSLLLEPCSSFPWVGALVLIGGGDGYDPLTLLTSCQTLQTVFITAFINIPINPAKQGSGYQPGYLLCWFACCNLSVHTSVARGTLPAT